MSDLMSIKPLEVTKANMKGPEKNIKDIMKQGKIKQMAAAPDSWRLNLLREVASTRVYNKRRENSKEIKGKTNETDESLKAIKDQLPSQENKKNKLKEYRKSNKMRQALECQIHDSDLQEALEKANNINKKGKDLQMKEGSAKEEQDSLNLELQGLTMGKTKLKLSLIDLQTR